MKSTLLLILLGAMPVLTQDALVSGVAVNGQTGEPLPGVHVRIIAGGLDGITAVYGAITGPEGRFSIERMQPGTYRIAAQRRGFIHIPGDGPVDMFRLKPGTAPAELKITMVRRAVITGRVLDRYGDPLPFASVQARPSKPGTRAIASMGGYMNADERGEYRLTLPPGKFHVQASPMQRSFNQIPETRTDGTPEPVYVPTYYPAAATVEQAVAVETTAGAELSGIDITLGSGQGLLSVSGTVTGLPAEQPFAIVTMTRGDRTNSSSHGMGVRQDGKFIIPRLEPGTIRLFARHEHGDVRLYSPVVEVTLSGSDITNIELPLGPGGELAGKLEVIGEAPATAAVKRKAALIPSGRFSYNMPRPGPVEVDKDGAFRIHGVSPGRFALKVEPLPENAFVKSVVLDGTPLPDRVLDLAQCPRNATVKIVVSPNGATVSGTVMEKPGEPAENVMGGVYLVSDPEDIRTENIAKAASKGRFSFKGVAPGKYKLFVIDSMRMRIPWAPDTLSKLAAAAQEVEVKEGDRITRDIVIPTKETGDAR